MIEKTRYDNRIGVWAGSAWMLGIERYIYTSIASPLAFELFLLHIFVTSSGYWVRQHGKPP